MSSKGQKGGQQPPRLRIQTAKNQKKVGSNLIKAAKFLIKAGKGLHNIYSLKINSLKNNYTKKNKNKSKKTKTKKSKK
tara:strand:+ start:24 stop:257 length:234 start_codon:yes stop_codon:yes gene_type:complete